MIVVLLTEARGPAAWTVASFGRALVSGQWFCLGTTNPSSTDMRTTIRSPRLSEIVRRSWACFFSGGAHD